MGGEVMFWVAKIKKKMGAWNSWYFLGWVVDAGPDPTYEEKVTPPPPALTLSLRADILHKNVKYDFLK